MAEDNDAWPTPRRMDTFYGGWLWTLSPLETEEAVKMRKRFHLLNYWFFHRFFSFYLGLDFNDIYYFFINFNIFLFIIPLV